MKILRLRLTVVFLLVLGICVVGPLFASEPVPISANTAFDAATTGIDPKTGLKKKVALVDVRSRAEYFWVGTATKVDEITLKNGRKIAPEFGKVRLNREGKFLTYRLDGRKKRIQVNRIASMIHSPIAINIPFKLWNEDEAKLKENPTFAQDIENLAVVDHVEVIIVYCRSGGRSTDCSHTFDTSQFSAVYEIDDPAGNRGHGGFEGNAYDNVYNGYLGFPARQTRRQTVRSVSWKDLGLPIKTLINPLP